MLLSTPPYSVYPFDKSKANNKDYQLMTTGGLPVQITEITESVIMGVMEGVNDVWTHEGKYAVRNTQYDLVLVKQI